MSLLHGRSVSLDVAVRVVEISLGGMAIETSLPFPVGAIQSFRLTLGDDSVAELTGRVMHCRNKAQAGAPPEYVTGVQFVEEDAAELVPVVDEIMGSITH